MENDETTAPRVSPKTRSLELGVFLFLIMPSTVLSAFVVKPGGLGFTAVAVSSIFKDLGFLFLILFFLWHNGELFSHIGFTLHKAGREIALGVGLFIPLIIAVSMIERAMRAAGLSMPEAAPSFLVPTGTEQYVLAFVLLIVIAVSEEVMFRGYLIRRFESLTGNSVSALIIAAFLFSLGHAYQMSGGVIGVGLLGIVFGVIFLWRKSLLAPMTMHFLQNFVGIILLPLSR
jgi:membrane protease YdiL (CAAX protease family)